MAFYVSTPIAQEMDLVRIEGQRGEAEERGFCLAEIASIGACCRISLATPL